MNDRDTASRSLRADSARGRIIAIMSGKGGSGKTMVAATMASVLARSAKSGEFDKVVLVDGDLGTGGLSYFLALNYVRNIRNGLTDLLLGDAVVNAPKVGAVELKDRYLQRVKFPARSIDAFFLPVGDFRRLTHRAGEQFASDRYNPGVALQNALARVVDVAAGPQSIVIVDCRGGIDDETLAIGRVADDIILVSEPDTTSFQATRHLAEVLGERNLGHKIAGFVLNKVFEDPTVARREGTSAFGAQSLTPVPFDPVATRAFLVGELPPENSVFTTHVVDALASLYPKETAAPPSQRLFRPQQYSALVLASPASARGGYVLSLLVLLLGTVLLTRALTGTSGALTTNFFLPALMAVGALAGIESFRRIVGRAVERYLRLVFRD
ncbi:CpaE family protein [Umezawaea endophytica]|uniref:CobQ/CobB/MinD/ParA nucleotide binding domain-containing protein n=1 Tax=Umezawaea endophytica TaxID=1654476 RepID=A0A9X2VQ87_9PSEU|nr:hypothetical protein [Umezawaea endophytica]MCS7480835.1 hypothetical protein [Umezawaea endophytica]